MKRIWKAIRRLWSQFTQPATGIRGRSGDWRVNYPYDPMLGYQRTHWMSYGDARNCQELWGGTLEWRHDND